MPNEQTWRVTAHGDDWRAVHDGRGSSAYQAVRDGDTVVALVVAHSSDPFADAPDTEKHARLIAAAPELLEFVEEYIEAFENGMAGDGYLKRMATAVIARATGQSDPQDPSTRSKA